MSRLRRMIYAGWVYGVTSLLMVAFVPLLLVPRAGMRGGLKLWAALIVWGMRVIGGVGLQVRGAEHLPFGSYIMAAKHQTMFDVITPFTFAPDALFVMKKELSRIPLYGWLSRKAAMIEIDRGAHAQALRRMIEDARRLMAEPRQLLIFPEGTRRPPGAQTDYKPGVAALYRELGLPCVPVATNSGVYLDAGGIVRKRGTVVIEILEPIAPGLKRPEFMRLLRERIETASTALLNP